MGSLTKEVSQFDVRRFTMKPILESIRATFFRSTEPADPPKAGQDLLTRLDDKTRSLDRDQTVFERERGGSALNLDGLMQVGKEGANGRVLNATQVSNSALLIAAPERRSEASDLIEACVNHQITHVVDLTEDNLVSGKLAGAMRPWAEELDGNQKSVHFRPAERWVSAKGLGFGNTATHRQVQVELKESGETRSQQLSWTRMACDDGNPIDPLWMLNVCRQIRSREQMVSTGRQNAKVAFMDGNGGDTAAAFAAANAIFRFNDRKPLSASDIDAEVVGICATLRSLRSTDLFSKRPDILDSLRQFSRLMIDQRTAMPERFDQAGQLRQERLREVGFEGALKLRTIDVVVHEDVNDDDYDDKRWKQTVKTESMGVDIREDKPPFESLRERQRRAEGGLPSRRPTGFQHSETRQQLLRDAAEALRTSLKDST